MRAFAREVAAKMGVGSSPVSFPFSWRRARVTGLVVASSPEGLCVDDGTAVVWTRDERRRPALFLGATAEVWGRVEAGVFSFAETVRDLSLRSRSPSRSPGSRPWSPIAVYLSLPPERELLVTAPSLHIAARPAHRPPPRRPRRPLPLANDLGNESRRGCPFASPRELVSSGHLLCRQERPVLSTVTRIKNNETKKKKKKEKRTEKMVDRSVLSALPRTQDLTAETRCGTASEWSFICCEACGAHFFENVRFFQIFRSARGAVLSDLL